MNENGTTDLSTIELKQQIWKLQEQIRLQTVLLSLDPYTLVETNRRLNRRCQAAEHQSTRLDYGRLVHTNRALNRRCQELESVIANQPVKLDKTLRTLEGESHRAHRYANDLRDIYRNHSKLFRCYGCWWCKLRWRVRRWLWRTWEIRD